jgi:hypothetical protein
MERRRGAGGGRGGSGLALLFLVVAACGGGGEGSGADAPDAAEAHAGQDPAGVDVEPGESVAPDASADADADAWELLYDPMQVLRYELLLPVQDLHAMLADPRCEAGTTPCGTEYVRGTLRVAGWELADVGIRFKGNSSLDGVARIADGQPGAGRYSFKVKTDEFVQGQDLDGIGTLNLHNSFMDPSLLREHLAYRAFRQAGVPASRTAFVDLWVNGERWGFYVSVQEVDKAFLRQHFGDDAGNLYKPEYGPLVYRGDSIHDYATTVTGSGGATIAQVPGDVAYQKKTNEKAADFSDLIALMEVLSNAPEQGFEEAVRAVLDVDRLLDALAVYAVIVALDGYGGGLSQNYYLYRAPATGRFSFIPWDLNNAFGTFDCFTLTAEQVLHLNPREPYCLGTPDATGGGQPIQPDDRPLISRLLAVPTLRDAYEARIRALLAGPLEPEALVEELEAAHSRIEPFVSVDPRAFYPAEDFARSLQEDVDHAPGLAAFVRARATTLAGLLDQPAACGDGTCTTGENCAEECQAQCPACQAWFSPKGMCVPSCQGACVCPATSPDGKPLVCDQAAGICHP